MDSSYSRILPRIHSSSERTRLSACSVLNQRVLHSSILHHTHIEYSYTGVEIVGQISELHVDRTRSPDVILKCRRNHRSPHG